MMSKSPIEFNAVLQCIVTKCSTERHNVTEVRTVKGELICEEIQEREQSLSEDAVTLRDAVVTLCDACDALPNSKRNKGATDLAKKVRSLIDDKSIVDVIANANQSLKKGNKTPPKRKPKK